MFYTKGEKLYAIVHRSSVFPDCKEGVWDVGIDVVKCTKRYTMFLWYVMNDTLNVFSEP